MAFLKHPTVREKMGIPEMKTFENLPSGGFLENMKAGKLLQLIFCAIAWVCLCRVRELKLCTHLLTHLATHQPTDLSYQPTDQLTYLLTFLLAYLPPSLPTFLPSTFPSFLPTYLPTCLPACLPAYLVTCVLYSALPFLATCTFLGLPTCLLG